MEFMSYRKCIACKKGWANEKTARDRKAWATSDEKKDIPCQKIGIAKDSVMRLILVTIFKASDVLFTSRGNNYCPDCIQEEKELEEKDKKRHHLLGYGGP